MFLCSVPELKKAAAGLKKDDRLVLSPNGDEAVRITTFTGGQAITREIGSIPPQSSRRHSVFIHGQRWAACPG